MWILFVILVLGGAGAAVTVSEKKRQEKRRQMAEERRKKREEALAKAREASKVAFEHVPHEEDHGEKLDVGEPPVYQPTVEEEPDVHSEMEKTQVYDPGMKSEGEPLSGDTKVMPEKMLAAEQVADAWVEPTTDVPKPAEPNRSFVVDENALDVLTGKFDYISEEMEEKEEKRRQRQEKKEQQRQLKEKKKKDTSNKQEPKEEKTSVWAVLGWVLGAIGCLGAVVVFGYYMLKPTQESEPTYTEVESSVTVTEESESESDTKAQEQEQEQNQEESSNVEEITTPVAAVLSEVPHAVAATQPANWGMTWEVFGKENEVLNGFDRVDDISFADANPYFALPGIATFRGNNFRDSGSYGTVSLNNKIFSDRVWTQYSASIPTSDGESAWTGSGWTGQPLVVQWDEETKQHMDLYDSAKAKEGLVEVIYATLDGTIYFMDLETGEYTRDSLYLGMTFKGSGALDPRGYPLMYVGSGDFTVEGRSPRMYVISLIDGTVLYEYGWDDPVAQRAWCSFDSSPLVDAETDTLIWPGENGVLYSIKLNTMYDAVTGAISVDPELTARTRYASERSNADTYWLGYEASISVIDRYAYLSENGGMFYCIDLDTMELVWAQDTKDDSNSTPVIEYDEETGRAYIYTAPSLHWTAEGGWGSISIYKLDAVTGEILWQKEYECGTEDGVSGGVQATPVIGKKGTNLENLIIYPIARIPDMWGGAMIAFDKETGNEVWRWDMDYYTWSSPVAVYNENGEGYLVSFDSQGGGFLLDGATGTVLDTTDVGSLVEASPIVYNNRIVVGTRGEQIIGIDLQ